MKAFALAIAAIVALFVIDSFLAKMEIADSRAEGERFFHSGQNLVKQGLNEQAAEQFRLALSVARYNREYQLAMGQSLIAAGRYSEAEAALADLLQKDATGGDANLAMARVLVDEGRITEAYSYYHRAIYGQWNQDARHNRVRVRFELVDLLVSQHATDGLLAELLPLQEEAPDNTETKMKLGRLFLAAGSPPRANVLFLNILRSEPQNADAYIGLGQAEFTRGNYRNALAHYLTVLRLRPEDSNAFRQIKLCNEVLALDPTQRGLNTDEQYRRSTKVLALAVAELRQCVNAAPSGTTKDIIDEAEQAAKRRATPYRQAAGVESNIELAGKLWLFRKTTCLVGARPIDESLDLVLGKLAQ